jgi:hypothetical protein
MRPAPALIWIKEPASSRRIEFGMPTLIFRCPTTDHSVQGWVAEEARADPAQQLFVTLRCTACGRAHLVNPVTAEVLGSGTHKTSRP